MFVIGGRRPSELMITSRKISILERAYRLESGIDVQEPRACFGSCDQEPPKSKIGFWERSYDFKVWDRRAGIALD